MPHHSQRKPSVSVIVVEKVVPSAGVPVRSLAVTTMSLLPLTSAEPVDLTLSCEPATSNSPASAPDSEKVRASFSGSLLISVATTDPAAAPTLNVEGKTDGTAGALLTGREKVQVTTLCQMQHARQWP